MNTASPPCARGTAAAEIRRDRLADVGRGWQPLCPVALARDDELARPPVEGIDREPRHLARPQPETDEEGEDREVSTPRRTAPIARGEEALDLGAGESARQLGQTPGCDSGNARGERTRQDPLDVEEAKQGAEGGHGQLGRAARLIRTAGDHERGDVGDRQPFEGEPIGRGPAGQERSDRGEVSGRGRRRQAPLDDDVPAVPGEEPIDRRI